MKKETQNLTSHNCTQEIDNLVKNDTVLSCGYNSKWAHFSSIVERYYYFKLVRVLNNTDDAM